MLDYATALSRVDSLKAKAVFNHERLPLQACSRRILAEDILAKIPSPVFTNSAMDGFAFKLADVNNSAAALRVDATLFAKALDPKDIPPYQKGSCVRIMTGAVVPSWADTVIPVEQCELTSDGHVLFKTLPTIGANIRLQGEDIKEGTVLLKAGAFLNPEKLMIAAAFGYPELNVEQLPRVILLTTGDELLEPSEVLPMGAIYNSNRYFLTSAIEKAGLKVDHYATLPDDSKKADHTLTSILGQDTRPTLILTTGAVSAGEKDFIPTLAEAMGFRSLFHRVAIRPGKPIFLASRNDAQTVWLGMPGNPVSTCVGWHFFARPLLTAWAKVPPAERRMVKLKNAVTKPESVRCFYRAEVNEGYAWIGRNQGSAELAPSINTDAYVELPEGATRLAADTKVEAVFV
jgi:molybdopterin molybdotransferase